MEVSTMTEATSAAPAAIPAGSGTTAVDRRLTALGAVMALGAITAIPDNTIRVN
jgi:hypothetical protein